MSKNTIFAATLFGVIGTIVLCGSTFAQSTATLNGSWRAISGTLHGQSVPKTALESMTLAISDGSFTANSSGLNSAGSLVLSPGASNQAQFSITSGMDSGRKLFAIYRVESNMLTIAYCETGFPTSFDSNASNRYLMLTYNNSEQAAAPGTAVKGGGSEGGNAGVID